MSECIQLHTVYIHDRGGLTRLFQLKNIQSLTYNRIRDDISDALIKITADNCIAQEGFLQQIRSMRHEIVIFRGQDRVWEGPVTRMSITADGIEIAARDIMHYVYRTAMAQPYDNSYPNTAYVIDRVKAILFTELQLRESLGYNLLDHVVYHQKETDARTTRRSFPMESNVWEHIDSLAENAGIDYTVLGRSMHFWDSHETIGTTPIATEADFLGPLTLTEYGADLTVRSIVTDGEGIWGSAGPLVDPYYGQIDVIDAAYDETTGTPLEDGDEQPTSEEMASQASRNLAGHNPAPLIVRVPDNSSVNPAGVLQLKYLVPGVRVPLRTTLLFRKVQQNQKMHAVKFDEQPGGETISITLVPAAGDEGDTGEG